MAGPYHRLLITGADGFVGRHLLIGLKRKFQKALIIAAVREKEGYNSALPHADQVIPFDLNSGTYAEMLISTQPDAVIHLAAQASVASSFDDPMAFWNSNLLGTVRLAESILRHAPQCRLVFASSAEVYGMSFQAGTKLDETALLRPANPYAASKAACDLALSEMQWRGLDVIRLRAFNHIGAGQSDKFVVASFAKQIAQIEAGKQDPVMQVGALDRWRDFLDVEDVCSAYICALEAKSAPDAVYNIASGKSQRIGDVLTALLAKSQISPRIDVSSSRLRPTDVEYVIGDNSKAVRDLGWKPVLPLDETLSKILEDWRNRVI